MLYDSIVKNEKIKFKKIHKSKTKTKNKKQNKNKKQKNFHSSV